MIWAKSWRNRHHFFQAQTEQRRAREQHKCERNLGNDEAVAKTLRGAVDRARARFRLQRVREMTAEVEPGDRHRDYHPKNHRADEANRSEPSIERDMCAERQTIRAEDLQQMRPPRADQDTE